MVATLQFNTKAHQEAYFGVPSMGAVLHTLNFRLHHDQLAWIINHAQDRVIICEGFLLPVLLAVRPQLTTVRHVLVVGAVPAGVEVPADVIDYRTKTGRPVGGIRIRIVDDEGTALPHDGVVVGELEALGPWVTSSYHGVDAPEKFHDDAGERWLRTGDVGSIDTGGYIQITDRAKDVIKSGGEWISSVELENALMGHPAVAEAAVVAVPDAQWDERPLACIVWREGATASFDDLAGFLGEHVAKWWIPERWAAITEVPKTSTFKFDKKVLRARYGIDELEVVTLGRTAR